MKNIIIIFALLIVNTMFAQEHKYSPIQPYRHDTKGKIIPYTIEEIKVFAMESTQLSHNWRREFIRVINLGLKKCGSSKVLTEHDVLWALARCKDTFMLVTKSVNSGRTGSTIHFFKGVRFEGDWFRFKDDNGCAFNVLKASCINIQEQEPFIYPKPLPPPLIPVKPPEQQLIPQRGGVIVDNRVSGGYQINGSTQQWGSNYQWAVNQQTGSIQQVASIQQCASTAQQASNLLYGSTTQCGSDWQVAGYHICGSTCQHADAQQHASNCVCAGCNQLGGNKAHGGVCAMGSYCTHGDNCQIGSGGACGSYCTCGSAHLVAENQQQVVVYGCGAVEVEGGYAVWCDSCNRRHFK